MNGLSKAIKHAGSMTALGVQLGVTKGVISQWKRRGQVPASYCPLIERLMDRGVRSEELNNTVDWDYIRKSRSTKKSIPP